MDLALAELLRPILAAAVGSAIAVGGLLGLGPRAAAKYQQEQSRLKDAERHSRILTAVRADIAIARRIAVHNSQSARHPGSSRPRAFIPLRTQFYEDLLTQGEITVLFKPSVLPQLTEYLLHARHVNAMIDAFARLESLGAEVNDLRAQYVTAIGQYSTTEIQLALGELEASLGSGDLKC